jgi:hypothetical protein
MNEEVYVTNQSIIKTTEDVAFMNRYKSNMWGGQFSTYTGIGIGLTIFYGINFLSLFQAPIENETLSFTLLILPIILLLYTLIIVTWRRELPICFNKKTQKVSAWIGGELAEIEWEKFHMFHTKIQDGAQATAKVFLFTLFGKSGKRYPMTIWDELPAGLYAYVHDFMNHKEPIIVENGKMEIARGNFQFTFKELFIQRFSFRKEENVFMRIFLVFSAIFFTLPIDFLMYGLNKVLPRRKIPKELLDACGCEEGERVYG